MECGEKDLSVNKVYISTYHVKYDGMNNIYGTVSAPGLNYSDSNGDIIFIGYFDTFMGEIIIKWYFVFNNLFSDENLYT